MAVAVPVLEFYKSYTTNINNSNHMLSNASTVIVDDASGFIVGAIVSIENEQVKITAINSNTLTVARAQNGTSAAQHNDNTAVVQGWVEALTWGDNSAVLICTITKSLDSPAIAEVILSNRSKDASANSTAASTGRLSGTADTTSRVRATIFSEFQDCRIYDKETGLFIFRGRVYSIRNQYDLQYGNTIKLVLNDMLQELLDLPVDDVHPNLGNVNPNTYNTRSKVNKRIIDKTTDYIDTSDHGTSIIAKFQQSKASFTAAEKGIGDLDEAGGITWDVSSGKGEILKVISDFAKQEPHATSSDSKHFGYDFFVDPNIISYNRSHAGGNSGKPSFNYFRRNTRPGDETTATYSTAALTGLTIEYPSQGWGGQTNFKRAMTTDSEFGNPDGAFYTAAVVHYVKPSEEKKARTTEDADAVGEGGEPEKAKVQTFELIRGTIASGVNFPWEGRDIAVRLQLPAEDTTTVSVDFNTGTSGLQVDVDPIGDGSISHYIFPGQPTSAGEPVNASHDNLLPTPMFLFAENSDKPCAVLQYQSGNANGTNNDYLMVSHVRDAFEGGESNTIKDDFGKEMAWAAWPVLTGTQTTKLFLAKYDGTSNPQASTAHVNRYIVIDANSRARDRYGINKPYVYNIPEEGGADSIRKKIAATLDRSTQAVTTVGKVRLSRYPYTKVIAPASTIARSGNVLTVTGEAFKDSAGDGENNIGIFGGRVGMVVAELNGTDGGDDGVIRYSYISALSVTSGSGGSATSTITYGTSATDTSDGTAIDASKSLAVFIPLEAGHGVHFINKLFGVNYGAVVQKIQYNFSPGVLTTTVEGLGINSNNGQTNANLINLINPESASTSDVDFPPQIPAAGQTWMLEDGVIEIRSRADSEDELKLTSTKSSKRVTLRILSTGQRYQIQVADGSSGYPYLQVGNASGNFGHADFSGDGSESPATNRRHIIFFRTQNKNGTFLTGKLQAIALDRRVTSSSNGKIWPEINTEHDIIIGWAQRTTSGLVFKLNPLGAIGSPQPISSDDIGNNALSNALLKPSARAWTTDLKITGLAWNTIAWNNGTANTNALLTFANGDTASIAASNSTVIVTQASAGPPATSTDSARNDKTQYMYITLPAEPTSGSFGTLTPAFTTSHATALADNKIILALVLASTTQNKSTGNQPAPLILPYNSKEPTINAISIMADTIHSDHIQANSIGTNKITFNSDVLGQSLATIRGVSGGTSGTIASIAVRSGTLYGVHTDGSTPNGGNFKDQDTPWFIRGAAGTDEAGHEGTAGDFSLGANFAWDASEAELTIEGDSKFKGAVEIGSGNSIFKANSNGIYLGHASHSSAPFYVEMDGTLTTGSSTIPSVRLSSNGLRIGSTGTDTSGVNNYLSFGWHASSASDALGIGTIGTSNNPTSAVSLGGFELSIAQLNALSGVSTAVSGNSTPYETKIFHFVWYQNPSSGMIQFHNLNRGSIGNLTSIGPGDLLANTHMRPPDSEAGDEGKFLRMQTDQRTNIGGTLYDNTGFPDLPWSTEWSADLTIDSAAIASGSVPTSKYGIFKYTSDGGGGTADTLGFLSNQQSATPNAGTDRSAFWIMQSESGRLIFEPSVDYDGANNNAWIGWHNALAGIDSYYLRAGNGTAAAPSITFYNNSDNGFFHNTSQGTGTISVTIGGTEEYVFSGSYFRPEDDGDVTLGYSSKKWGTVFSTNGTINTSDLRSKTQIQPTTLGLDFINSLNPVSYKWKDKLHQPTHQGLIAQEVLESLGEAGIQSRDEFGALDGDEDTTYGLNYGEFVPILIKAIKELTEKIKRLEEEK